MAKYTDEQIKKALECLKGFAVKCRDCAYSPRFKFPNCRQKAAHDALDIINRQEAEIEVLQKTAETQQSLAQDRYFEIKKLNIERDKLIAEAKSEAIKEFAERLKEKGIPVTGGRGFEGVYVMCSNVVIDNLVKETVGK